MCFLWLARIFVSVWRGQPEQLRRELGVLVNVIVDSASFVCLGGFFSLNFFDSCRNVNPIHFCVSLVWPLLNTVLAEFINSSMVVVRGTFPSEEGG